VAGSDWPSGADHNGLLEAMVVRELPGLQFHLRDARSENFGDEIECLIYVFFADANIIPPFKKQMQHFHDPKSESL
jgi:hypothetical protein